MYNSFFKRLLDIILSLFVLPFFCILFIIVAPLIWFSDKGPIFYNASRLGQNGKIYKMYKFRSMKVNAPDIRNADGSTFNSDNDPRVTSIGKLLRKTSIDEVPQFLNVLKGDMSLVGPRPHVISAGFKYENLPEEKKHRLLVKPGITGFNQAYYRNSVSSEEKIKNDNYYVDHISLLLDIKIVLHTIISVLKRDNINTVIASDLSDNKVGANK